MTIPLKAGHNFQTPSPPTLRYCPSDSSRKNIGIPAKNRVIRYGTRNAPTATVKQLVKQTDKYCRVLLHKVGSTSRANRVQACCHGLLVSGEQSSDVLERPLHSGHRRQQPTPTFSQPASTDCTAQLANYIRPSGFLCCRPDGLELATGPIFLVCLSVLVTLRAPVRRYYSRVISAFSAIEMYA